MFVANVLHSCCECAARQLSTCACVMRTNSLARLTWTCCELILDVLYDTREKVMLACCERAACLLKACVVPIEIVLCA